MLTTKQTPQKLTLPDGLTLLVVFAIYTNLAVLAVNFHGMPGIVAIAVPLLLLLPLSYHLLIKREKIVIPTSLPWLVLFLLVLMVSTLFSRDVSTAFDELIVYLTEGLVLYLLLVNIVRTSKMLRLVIWALLAAAIVLGGVPLYQQITGNFDNNFGGLGQISEATFRTGSEDLQGDVRQVRLAGAIGEMNRFAQVMLILIPLGMFRFYAESSPLLRILALLSAGLAGAGMVLAFSRGAAVAFVLLVGLMVFLKVIRPMQLMGFIVGAALLLVAMPQYSSRLVSIPSVTSIFTGESTSEETAPDGAIEGRLTEMLAAARVYADHPLIGVGPGMFRYYSRAYSLDLGMRYLTDYREAHSLFLGIGAEAGTLGLLAFLLMLAATLRDLLRVRHESQGRRPDLENLATSFMLALLAYLTAGLFLHLSYMRYFWIMFALASTAGFVGKQELGLTSANTARTSLAYANPRSME